MKWTGISSCAIRRRISARGFTLTEFAIVMGVIGLILGSVWVFVSQSWENARQEQLKTEIAAVVKNVRAYYTGQNGIGNAATPIGTFPTLTPKLIGLNIIPNDIVHTSGTCTNAGNVCANNPWGASSALGIAQGTFGVCAYSFGCTSSNQQFFSVEVGDMPQGACVNAVMANSGSTAPQGLYDVVINGASMAALGALPPTVGNAKTNCGGATNTIDFVFRLVAPQS